MRRVKPQPQVPEVVSQSSYRGFLPKISLGSTPKPRAKPKATPKQGNSMRVPFLPMIRTEVAKVSSENLVSKMCRSKDKADVVLPPIARGLGGTGTGKRSIVRASKSKKNANEVYAESCRIQVISGKNDLKKASLRINPADRSNNGGISWHVEDPTSPPTRASRPVSRGQRRPIDPSFRVDRSSSPGRPPLPRTTGLHRDRAQPVGI